MKVRCINDGFYVYLTEGNTYKVVGETEYDYTIVNDENREKDYSKALFEEVVEFKVGDKVVKLNGDEWINKEYRVVTGFYFKNGMNFFELDGTQTGWTDSELKLYEEPKQQMTLEEKEDLLATLEQKFENKDRELIILEDKITELKKEIKEEKIKLETKTYNVRVYRDNKLVKSEIIKNTMEKISSVFIVMWR